MSVNSSAVGGFFGLELPTIKGALPPANATLLRSGRACLRAILELMRPERLFVPFYVCDAAWAPARALNIAVHFYRLDQALRPILPTIGEHDAVVVVDYFGLCATAHAPLAFLGDRLIMDQTHALFADGPADVWRFTSARKWFGVPDGAFLGGPRPVAAPDAKESQGVPTHLVERRWGNAAAAYQAYTTAEAAFGNEVESISTTSIALLRGVDVELVRRARRQNFGHLHSRLGAYNQLALPLGAADVPFCYPLLPSRQISRAALAGKGAFVPQFWADCLERRDDSFEWEILLSERLLPLPIDHRYGEQEMNRLAELVLHSLHEGGS